MCVCVCGLAPSPSLHRVHRLSLLPLPVNSCLLVEVWSEDGYFIWIDCLSLHGVTLVPRSPARNNNPTQPPAVREVYNDQSDAPCVGPKKTHLKGDTLIQTRASQRSPGHPGRALVGNILATRARRCMSAAHVTSSSLKRRRGSDKLPIRRAVTYIRCVPLGSRGNTIGAVRWAASSHHNIFTY